MFPSHVLHSPSIPPSLPETCPPTFLFWLLLLSTEGPEAAVRGSWPQVSEDPQPPEASPTSQPSETTPSMQKHITLTPSSKNNQLNWPACWGAFAEGLHIHQDCVYRDYPCVNCTHTHMHAHVSRGADKTGPLPFTSFLQLQHLQIQHQPAPYVYCACGKRQSKGGKQ